MNIRVADVIGVLERLAPLAYQESYDNSGLQVGDRNAVVTGMLVTLDITEAVLLEAEERGCNLIIAHHPVIFSGLKKLTGSNYVERTVLQAIKKNIALYAIHTNLDNMLQGVNAAIAERLRLIKPAILSMKMDTLRKLYTYVPKDSVDAVREALFQAGAGQIGEYTECSFSANGIGTFRPGQGANPVIGQTGGGREYVEEVKLEVLVQRHREYEVLQTLFKAHPYEEVAYEFVALQNANQEMGAGLIGELPEAMDEMDFLRLLRTQMNAVVVRHTALPGKTIKKVAVCGGSGSFLLKDAIRAGADVFVTADFKYHQFFDADGKILVADIGHYESEQFTRQLLGKVLTDNFPSFAVLLSNLDTNPVKYFHE